MLLKYLFPLPSLKGTPSYAARPREQHPGEEARAGEGRSQVSIRPWRARPRDREMPLLSFFLVSEPRPLQAASMGLPVSTAGPIVGEATGSL